MMLIKIKKYRRAKFTIYYFFLPVNQLFSAFNQQGKIQKNQVYYFFTLIKQLFSDINQQGKIPKTKCTNFLFTLINHLFTASNQQEEYTNKWYSIFVFNLFNHLSSDFNKLGKIQKSRVHNYYFFLHWLSRSFLILIYKEKTSSLFILHPLSRCFLPLITKEKNKKGKFFFIFNLARQLFYDFNQQIKNTIEISSLFCLHWLSSAFLLLINKEKYKKPSYYFLYTG